LSICSCTQFEKDKKKDIKNKFVAVDTLLLKSHLTIANDYERLNKLDSCNIFLIKAYILYEQGYNWIKAINLLQQISWNYLLSNQFDSTFTYLNKGISIAENDLKDLKSLRLCQLYNNYGIVLLETDKTEKAFEYFENAHNLLMYKSWQKDELHNAGITHNKSFCDFANDENKRAINRLQKNLINWTAKLTVDNIHVGIYYNHLANICLSDKDYETSKAYYQKSLMISTINFTFDHPFKMKLTKFLAKVSSDSTKQQNPIMNYNKILKVLSENIPTDSLSNYCNIKDIYTTGNILNKTIKYYFKPSRKEIYKPIIELENTKPELYSLKSELPTNASVGSKNHYILSLYYSFINNSTKCHPRLNNRSDINIIAMIEMLNSLNGLIKCHNGLKLTSK